MTLNCKQGDMAIVVRSRAGNAGKVVTCLEFIGEGPEFEDGNWLLGNGGG
jgi:hypothetical protein